MKNENIFLRAQGRAAMMGVWFLGLSYAFTGNLIPGYLETLIDIEEGFCPNLEKDIQEAGLKVQGFFIIGYPGERPQDLGDSLDLIRKCKFNFVLRNVRDFYRTLHGFLI